MATNLPVADESDGKAVNVTLSYDVDANTLVYAEGFFGISATDGASGDVIALTIESMEYQVELPGGLDPAKGAILYAAAPSGYSANEVQSADLSTSSGSGKVPVFKVTGVKDSDGIATVILLPPQLPVA